MTFNSIEFLFFLPVVLVLHHSLPERLRWVLLLVASYVFYMAARLEWGLLLAAATLTSFLTAKQIHAAKDRRIRRRWLAVSLSGNLGMLVLFKYLDFIAENVLRLLPAGVSTPEGVAGLEILLPVGISFYTFQAIGYSIDVYRGVVPPERNLGRYALYVSFFPQLVAGPIERSRSLLPQLRGPLRWDTERASSGLLRIAWGFFKKLVIADRLGIYVDSVFADPGAHSGPTLLLASYLFAFQLYCDFSAYSDIAIGCGRLFGVELMENFRRPFLARTIGEFWQRWHISLTTWFRDYVYLPLARRRRLRAHPALDFLPLFILIGIWHGASWTFVLFGALHGSYMALSAFTSRPRARLRRRVGGLPAPLQVLLTFHLVLISVVLFRAESLEDAVTVYTRVVTMADARALSLLPLGAYGFSLALAAIVVLEIVQGAQEAGVRHRRPSAQIRTMRTTAVYLLGASTLMFGAFGHEEFIYFQF